MTTVENIPVIRTLDVPAARPERPVLDLGPLPNINQQSARVDRADIDNRVLVREFESSLEFRQAVGYFGVAYSAITQGYRDEVDAQLAVQERITQFMDAVDSPFLAATYLDKAFPLEQDGETRSWGEIIARERREKAKSDLGGKALVRSSILEPSGSAWGMDTIDY